MPNPSGGGGWYETNESPSGPYEINPNDTTRGLFFEDGEERGEDHFQFLLPPKISSTPSPWQPFSSRGSHSVLKMLPPPLRGDKLKGIQMGPFRSMILYRSRIMTPAAGHRSIRQSQRELLRVPSLTDFGRGGG
ncbi:hypothetical protein CEXT_693651 [Caerostris extrusa]|uniref:Uncharacterized protein n=1 Tax=Caerostris extrusa TaxID=172846 RepID=A0AAV4XYA3_CAEEX|nr:hypothetical protein CEXT_693651 [Caerostris extrusa]